jgi:hypothetical protein
MYGSSSSFYILEFAWFCLGAFYEILVDLLVLDLRFRNRRERKIYINNNFCKICCKSYFSFNICLKY